jgi:hypothetical protein
MQRYKLQIHCSQPIGPDHDNPLALQRDFDYQHYKVRLNHTGHKNHELVLMTSDNEQLNLLNPSSVVGESVQKSMSRMVCRALYDTSYSGN